MKEQSKIKKTGMARLWQLTFMEKALVISSAVLAIISTAITFVPFIAIYFIIKKLIMNINNLNELDSVYIIRMGWISGGLVALAILFIFISLICSHFAAFRTLYALKLDFTRHLASLSLGFHTENSTGKLRKS